MSEDRLRASAISRRSLRGCVSSMSATNGCGDVGVDGAMGGFTMSERRKGPRVSLVVTCDGCAYERCESYRRQGDSGHDVYCTHKAHGTTKKYIGDTTWNTPMWCPLRKDAVEAFVAEVPR